MSPPIYTPDGNEVTKIVLPDGSTASEVVAPDGSVVFDAGPEIPDSGLDHLWWGPSISDISTFPDEEGMLDMSASGAPTLSDINGRQASLYDSIDDDHAVGQAPSLGTSDVWTSVVVAESTDTSTFQTMFSVGSNTSGFGGYAVILDGLTNDNQWRLDHVGVDNVGGGTPDSNPHVFVGTYDGSNVILDVDGVEVINGTITAPNAPQAKTSIAQRGDNADYFNGAVGAAGHEAAAANSARRDELTQLFGDEFNITVSV